MVRVEGRSMQSAARAPDSKAVSKQPLISTVYRFQSFAKLSETIHPVITMEVVLCQSGGRVVDELL